MNTPCDYCKTLHEQTNCPNCGAPVTRSTTKRQLIRDQLSQNLRMFDSETQLLIAGQFGIYPVGFRISPL